MKQAFRRIASGGVDKCKVSMGLVLGLYEQESQDVAL